jgi:hypothetical protein
VCDACGTVVRGYQYRFYPAGSPFFERCVGVAWCTRCKAFDGSMVHVPRDVVLVDALAKLPLELQDQLRQSDRKLVQYLDARWHDEE